MNRNRGVGNWGRSKSYRGRGEGGYRRSRGQTVGEGVWSVIGFQS